MNLEADVVKLHNKGRVIIQVKLSDRPPEDKQVKFDICVMFSTSTISCVLMLFIF